jgi:hypothetical protein
MKKKGWFTTVKNLLNYSFKDIDWDYSKLTDAEKALVTKEEFTELEEIFN